MMSKKERRVWKVAGQPLEEDKSVPFPDGAGKILAEREVVVIADKQAAFSREEDAKQREVTANQREEAADQREEAADQREQIADQREEIANQREEIANQREEIAGQREEAADQRQKTTDRRQEAALQREVTADRRQVTADRREDTADQREEIADQREEIANQREEAASVQATFSESTQAQLREVNERLVVTAINAQKMTEAAELTAERISHIAEHDFLTGLPNRALLTDRLAQSIELAQRHGKKLALIYLDLDHFKHINDSLGHEIGDKVLQSAATRLQTCVRLSDTVSRQGGDEFVVLLPEVEDVQEAVVTAKKLIEAMAQPHLVTGHELRVTISIGISIYPDDGQDSETVVRNADTAMYQAKKTGRNTYQLFNPK